VKTTVVNVRGKSREDLEADPLFVYVGRAVGRSSDGWPASDFGNPYRASGRLGSIAAVRDFEKDLRTAIREPGAQRVHPCFHAMAKALPTLRGKKLGCWCCSWPGEGEPEKPCHAVVLARLADEIGGGK